MTRAFRFGHQLGSGTIDDLIDEAQRAEQAGYDIVTIPDHIGPTLASPLITLAAIARHTERIRLGTFVLNAEMRNPVQLAWDAATTDRLAGGRLELGLGAGHTAHEFEATGIELAPPSVRKARAVEAARVIRRLLAGERVDFVGDHMRVSGAEIEPATQQPVPLMLAGNGAHFLTAAADIADIVGLNGLGRTLADGHRHAVRFSVDRADEQIAQIRAATARDIELNALVQRVVITDDRHAAAADVAEAAEGLTIDEALTTPYLAFGTHDEIAAQLQAARARWGFSYFVTRSLDAMAPIVRELSGR